MGDCGDSVIMQIADRLKNFLLVPICVDKAVGEEANTLLAHLFFYSALSQ